MAGPTNQIDWGQLLGMYSQAADAAQPQLRQQQNADAAKQQQAIQQALGGIESNTYANVGKGVAGQVTAAPGYSGLIDQYNQHEAQKYANQVEGAAWETMFKNPGQSTTPGGPDPWDSVKDRLDAIQSGADKQAQWNLGQQQRAQDQANRQRDDNVTGAGFRAAWDKWIAGGGVAPDFQPPNPKGEWKTRGGRVWPDAPQTTPNAQRLTSNMEASQKQWRDQHGGSLDGWYDSLAGTYYRRAMGGYTPQTYQYTPQGGYAGGYGNPAPQTNPNTTNTSTAKPDDDQNF